MRKTILFTAAFLAASVTLPAQAQTASSQQAVSTAGLDLGRPADRARLQRRLADAVENVCGSYAATSADEQRVIGRCRRAAWAGVETQLAALASRRDRVIQVAAATR